MIFLLIKRYSQYLYYVLSTELILKHICGCVGRCVCEFIGVYRCVQANVYALYICIYAVECDHISL